MADCRKVSKQALLLGMRERGVVYAPTTDGRWAVCEAQSLPEVGSIRPKRPLRDLFTPPTREIARWRENEGPKPRIEPVDPDRSSGTVFGVRPCDARALAWLDRVFLAEPHVDVHYRARREALLLIGVACEPQPACHCGLLGLGPDEAADMDVMLSDTHGGYLAVADSERGRKFLSSLSESTPAEAPGRRAGPRPDWWTDFPAPEALMAAFEHPVWEDLQVGCMNCGACTLYCPTCQCFTIADETFKGHTMRLRVIDTCQRSDFTRMAGGHNPRQKHHARLRQRVLHKFAYIPHGHDGALGCSGCGRCVELCGLRRHLFADLVEIGGRITEEKSCGT